MKVDEIRKLAEGHLGVASKSEWKKSDAVWSGVAGKWAEVLLMCKAQGDPLSE